MPTEAEMIAFFRIPGMSFFIAMFFLDLLIVIVVGVFLGSLLLHVVTRERRRRPERTK